MTLRLAFFAVATLVCASFFGCEEVCTYPDQQFFKLRLLNAMPDQPKITVFINGKLFKRDFTYAPPPDFGYTDRYADGSPLPLGKDLSLVVTSDPAGLDTIHTGTFSPSVHRQTLIIMGRGKKLLAIDPSSTRHLLLDDEDATQKDDFIMIRMVHAIPDLPALDIYFAASATGTPDIANLRYGEASPRIVRSTFPGLTVTEAGNPSNVIFSVATPFGGIGFFVTAVVRGTSEPCDSEPVPAPLLLSDISRGNFIIDFPVFGVRLVNGTRNTKLSLSATNPPPLPQDPRMNIPGQEKVKNIPPDSASEFLGVGIAQFSNTRWYYVRDTNRFDTVFAMNLLAKVNERWTFLAFENAANAISGIAILDTMACVPEAFGKMRIINLSPDAGPVTVQVSGANNLSMSQGTVGFHTLPSGQKQITISSGSGTQSHSIALPPARPISIYILPPKPGQAFPITISND